MEWEQVTDSSAQLRRQLEGCAEQLAAAERELSLALLERNRAAINRARIAVDRIRKRRAWIASRLGYRAHYERAPHQEDSRGRA